MGACSAKQQKQKHPRKAKRVPPPPAARASPEPDSRVCDGCGERVSASLLGCCPRKMRVAAPPRQPPLPSPPAAPGAQGSGAPEAGRKLVPVHEAVCLIAEGELLLLDGFRRSSPQAYSAARIQRWWRHHLLYRRWLGTIFQLVWLALGEWREQRQLRPDGREAQYHERKLRFFPFPHLFETAPEDLQWPDEEQVLSDHQCDHALMIPTVGEIRSDDEQQVSTCDEQQVSTCDEQQVSTCDEQQVSTCDNQQVSTCDEQQVSTCDNQQVSKAATDVSECQIVFWKTLATIDEKEVTPECQASPTNAISSAADSNDQIPETGPVLSAVVGSAEMSLKWPKRQLHECDRKVDILRAIMRCASARGGIPRYCALDILCQAQALLTQRSPVQRVALCQGRKCLVVGDLHGQLPDLLRCLEEYGLPSPMLFYIFNGDLVDRGPKGCEVILIVLSLLLAYPDFVFVNRGNHEDKYMNKKYGFLKEAQIKIGVLGYTIFKAVFRHMPLCAVVNDDVFVAHGGIPRDDVTIDEIDRLDIASIGSIPHIGESDDHQSLAERVLTDLTWSDPLPEGRDCPGTCTFNEARGSGVWFTKEHTVAFLAKNDLKFVIRSHEAPETGFSTDHGGLVYTVFSASYYADARRNDGAVAVMQLEDNQLSHRSAASASSAVALGNLVIWFDTWRAWGDDSVASVVSSIREAVGENESTQVSKQQSGALVKVVRTLHEFIFEHRHMLLHACQSKDTNGPGRVPGRIGCLEWAAVLRNASGCFDLPWAFLRSLVAPAEFPEKALAHVPGDVVVGVASINYLQCLKQFNISLQHRVLDRWAPYLVRYLQVRMSECLATPIEWEGVSYSYFFALIVEWLGFPLPAAVVFHLFCYLGPDDTGRLTEQQCAAKFELVQARSAFESETMGEGEDSWVPDRTFYMWDLWLACRLRDLVLRCSSAAMAFTLFDQDGDGEVGREDLLAATDRVTKSSQHCPRRRVVCTMTARSSLLEKQELEDLRELLGNPVETTRRDPDHVSGDVAAWPLSDEQISRFLSLLDADGDGRVTYHDFLRSFFVGENVPTSLLSHQEAPMSLQHFWYQKERMKNITVNRSLIQIEL
ncbi:Serine/threonine-protein phosphatase rdgC [Diplonema papillatum]|nr:Serine/threonine-protein phosphatase rdgC [Diplonema papillatum]